MKNGTLRKDGTVDYQRLYEGLAARRNRGKQIQLPPSEWISYVFTSDEVECALSGGLLGGMFSARQKIHLALRRCINEGYLASDDPGQTKRDIRLTEKGMAEYRKPRLVPPNGTDEAPTLPPAV